MNTIEALAKVIQLQPKRLLSDIKELAWSWDEIMEANPSSPKQAVTTLHLLVRLYLRGLGYRMGNIQGFRAHRLKLAFICTEVCRYVIENGRYVFPTLHQLGFSSWETAVDFMRKGVNDREVDILAEAERILRDKQ